MLVCVYTPPAPVLASSASSPNFLTPHAQRNSFGPRALLTAVLAPSTQTSTEPPLMTHTHPHPPPLLFLKNELPLSFPPAFLVHRHSRSPRPLSTKSLEQNLWNKISFLPPPFSPFKFFSWDTLSSWCPPWRHKQIMRYLAPFHLFFVEERSQSRLLPQNTIQKYKLITTPISPAPEPRSKKKTRKTTCCCCSSSYSEGSDALQSMARTARAWIEPLVTPRMDGVGVAARNQNQQRNSTEKQDGVEDTKKYAIILITAMMTRSSVSQEARPTSSEDRDRFTGAS